MPYYRTTGSVPPKRRTRHRDAHGDLHHEELMGEKGFSSDSSLLYRRNIPPALADVQPRDLGDTTLTPDAPLRPLHLKLHDLVPAGSEKGVDVVRGRRLLLGNGDVRISSEPLTGRIQQPPVHQVWEGPGFVGCNFAPRKVDHHPLAIPAPSPHSKVDSDEVMFSTAGDDEARKGSGIGRGSVSLHPGGHAHGPQPGAMEASLSAERFDETAVMVDTFRPLDLGEGALACLDDDHRRSWTGGCRGGAAPGPGGAR